MSNQTLSMTPDLYQYLLDTSLREPELLKQLREETAKDEMARMQIAPEQGQFMSLLVKLMNARKIIEVGTFTGYSSIIMAMNMQRPAQMVCCDMDEKWTNMAKDYWQKAGVDDICDLRLAPANDTLDELLKSGEQGSYDLAFIDADKANYDDYFEKCLRLLRPGGLILVDNTLWGGSVIDHQKNDEDTMAIRAFNKKRQQDNRIQLSHLPIADGLTLCVKI